MKKGKLFVVLTTVISIFLASCNVEIGLGPAVDTEAPKLKVYEASNDSADPNYKPVPKAGDVVRSYFMLAGQATDDKEIKSFTIAFKNLLFAKSSFLVFLKFGRTSIYHVTVSDINKFGLFGFIVVHCLRIVNQKLLVFLNCRIRNRNRRHK